MIVDIECTYCGKKWSRLIYARESLDSEKCSKCNDKNLKVRDQAKSKIDYYGGSPPFPVEMADIFEAYRHYDGFQGIGSTE